MALTAVMMTLAACSQDDELQNDAPKPAAIEFEIFDGGYADVQTRAVEDGYRTKFVAGDVCGLYTYRSGDGNTYTNVKLTAEEGKDGKIVWKVDDAFFYGMNWDKYFIYYPYRENIGNMSIEKGYTDTDVFANLISSWTPGTDQSTYDKYTANDLMTAEGTATKLGDGRLKISFSMTHRMALAVIEVPRTVYKFTDTSIPTYVPTSVDFNGGDIKPLRMADGTYRCIVKPDAKENITSIKGMVSDGKTFTITPSEMPAGKYTRFVVGGGAVTEEEHNLQVGDYLLKDGSLLSKDVFTENDRGNVAAIVFSVGHNQYDKSDYSKTGIGSKECHGYAVAVMDAAQNCKWGPVDTPLGCYPEGGYSANAENDWSGYDYTWNKIIPKAGGSAFLEDSYPAAYYAVKHGANPPAYQQAPACSSGWFLPAIGQMKEVWTQRETLFRIFEGLSTEGNYWSSSESSDNQDTKVKTIQSSNDEIISDSNKDDTHHVRAVLAF